MADIMASDFSDKRKIDELKGIIINCVRGPSFNHFPDVEIAKQEHEWNLSLFREILIYFKYLDGSDQLQTIEFIPKLLPKFNDILQPEYKATIKRLYHNLVELRGLTLIMQSKKAKSIRKSYTYSKLFDLQRDYKETIEKLLYRLGCSLTEKIDLLRRDELQELVNGINF